MELSDAVAQNVTLRQALKDLAQHKAKTEPTNDVVEAFQILEDEVLDRNRLAQRAFELETKLDTAERELQMRELHHFETEQKLIEVGDALAYLDLHLGRYHWRQMTTEQKELMADLIDASGDRGEDKPPRHVDRWWR